MRKSLTALYWPLPTAATEAWQWQAYFLSGLLAVVVPLDADPHHARLVHDLLDDLTVLPDHFALGQEGEGKAGELRGRRQVRNTKCWWSGPVAQHHGPVFSHQLRTSLSLLQVLEHTNKVPGHLDGVLHKL